MDQIIAGNQAAGIREGESQTEAGRFSQKLQEAG